MWPFNKKKKERKPCQRELYEKIIENYKAMQDNSHTMLNIAIRQRDNYKLDLEKEEKLHNLTANRIPILEFILGSRETGWVWRENLWNFPLVSIGQPIYLDYQLEPKGPTGFDKVIPHEFVVKEFEGITMNDKTRKISFYVELKNKPL